jgi:NAD(P)-dependent dehydrogenase (short-subunit alcohol dehydrogenase family)
MDLELTGKVAVVTGGSRGIGKAIARELAREGADIALVARDPETLTATRDEIAGESGRRVAAFVADTTDEDAVRAMGRGVIEAFGGADILVNSAAQPAGQSRPPGFGEIDTAAFDDEMHTKVLGYLRCAREFIPGMKSRGWGRIVNISGLGARNTGNILGSIRNVGVVALTKNLADELGAHGINVTVVHPGTTRTEKTPGVIAARAEARGLSPAEIETRMASENAIRRLVDAREIAYVVAFLCSPKAIAINGDVIAAGGGDPGSIYY